MTPVKEVEYTIATATTTLDRPADASHKTNELKLETHVEDASVDDFEFEYIDVYTLAIVDESTEREHHEYLATGVIDHEHSPEIQEVILTYKDGTKEILKNALVLHEKHARHTINELHDKARYL